MKQGCGGWKSWGWEWRRECRGGGREREPVQEAVRAPAGREEGQGIHSVGRAWRGRHTLPSEGLCALSQDRELYPDGLCILFLFAQIISNITVLNFLQALGYPYTKEELLESELDVLKSLDFQINLPTPLAYVEMLLEVLGTSQVVEKVGWRLFWQAQGSASDGSACPCRCSLLHAWGKAASRSQQLVSI